MNKLIEAGLVEVVEDAKALFKRVENHVDIKKKYSSDYVTI